MERRAREEREACRVTSRGLDWRALDADVSAAGFPAGLGDQGWLEPEERSPRQENAVAKGMAEPGPTMTRRPASYGLVFVSL